MKGGKQPMGLERRIASVPVMAGIVLTLDVTLFLLITYLWNMLRCVPLSMLAGTGSIQESLFGVHNLDLQIWTFPDLFAVLLLLVVLDMILIYRIRAAFGEKNMNLGQKGVERFATRKEIQEQYLQVEEVEKGYAGDPGIPLSRLGNKRYLDTTNVHNLILGMTRSGKGELFVKSSIETYSRAEKKPSLIINDSKLELYKVFQKKLKERGYQVYLLNCSDPRYSMGYNPITMMSRAWQHKDYDMAEQLANSFAHSYFEVDRATGNMRYFVQAASSLCVAMILAAVDDAVQAEERYNQERYEKWKDMGEEYQRQYPFQYEHRYERTMNLFSMITNFEELVQTPVDDTGLRTKLDVYFEQRLKGDRAKLSYISTKIAPGKTKASVFSEMLGQLRVFTLGGVAKMTAESSLDLEEIGFGETPTAVFLATPSYDRSLYRLPTIFIRQVYYALGRRCDSGKGKCDRRVIHILDEFGNMPPIEMLETEITMGLGQNISFDLYLQSYEQLEKVYGKEVAEIVKANCGNHIYILTESEDTAREFSRKLGSRSFIGVSRSGGRLSMDKTYTESVEEFPLLDANRLLQLMEGECVIKRTMMRRDRKGRKIRPYPLFNSRENGMYLKYAYEYFPEEYPDPDAVDLLEVCQESREHIQPKSKEYLWDITLSFKLFEQEQKKNPCLGEAGYRRVWEILARDLDRSDFYENDITPQTSMGELQEWFEQLGLSQIEKKAILEIVREEMGAAHEQ